MELNFVPLEIPDGCNLILGQAHFIKTVDDLYELLAATVPQGRFGIGFSEASGPCLIRTEGNDESLIAVCVQNLLALRSGHVFCILLRDAFPLAVLNQIKSCSEVCRIFCATANPLEAVVAASARGCGVLGVIDGFGPRGVEAPADRAQRKEFLRTIGYKS